MARISVPPCYFYSGQGYVDPLTDASIPPVGFLTLTDSQTQLLLNSITFP